MKKKKYSRTDKRTGCKVHLKEPWLEAFKQTQSIGDACDRVAVSRSQITAWRREDPDFREKYFDAFIKGTEAIEKSAYYRAVVGVAKPIYQGGQKVGEVREPSDTLAIFLLKARDKKYRNWYTRQVDNRFIQMIVEEFSKVIHKNVPALCPHCNNSLAMKPAIARDLQALSKKLEQESKF